MKIEGKWKASSVDDENKGEELINMVGIWGIGIDVQVVNPYTYSKFPIEHIGRIYNVF